MRAHRSHGERGITLVELLIALAVAGIFGTALVRSVMTEARMAQDRELWRTARQVARSSSNLLASELRMVETTGGIVSAANDGSEIVARVPYAFGVLCATTGLVSTVALMPVDSVMFTAPGFAGFAWRNESTGAYTYVSSGVALALNGVASTCTLAGITPVAAQSPSPAGQVVVLTGTIPVGTAPGTVIFLFRRVRYEFKASALVSGLNGLWRTDLTTGATQELAAPVHSTARFRYYVAGSATAQTTPPSPISNIRGIEAALDGRSETVGRMSANARVMPLRASVFFQNTAN